MIYRSNLNVTQALEELRKKFRQPEIARLLEFIPARSGGFAGTGSKFPEAGTPKRAGRERAVAREVKM